MFFSLLQALWFGDDYLRIVGVRSCSVDCEWDDNDLKCERGVLPLLVIIESTSLNILELACCCGCIVLLAAILLPPPPPLVLLRFPNGLPSQ